MTVASPQGSRERNAGVLAAAILLLPIAAREAGAQVDSEAPAPAVPQTIEEIVVTAQKTEQDVRDVAISMTVMDDEFLRRAGVTDFHDAALHAPNTTIDDSSQFADIRVRGFGSPLANKAFEQSVGLAIDGIAYGRSPYWRGPLFDLDRVEVLRGPQGTLFGKNTTAGLFNVVTKKPTDEYEGFLQAELGEIDHRRFEAAIGGPLRANVVNFRLSALSDERDGNVDNTTAATQPFAHEALGARDRKGVRFQLGFPDVLGARFSIGYEKVEIESIGVGWEFREVEPDALAFYREYDPETDVDPDNHRGSTNHPDRGRNEIDTIVANLGYEIAAWSLSAVTGHTMLSTSGSNELDFGPAPMLWTDSEDENPQTTLELRLDSPALGGLLGSGSIWGLALGESRLTTGFFFERRELADSRLPININVPVAVPFVLSQRTGTAPLPVDDETLELLSQSGLGVASSTGFFDQTGTAFAGFGHLIWEPVAPWTIETGTRFSYESKKAHWERVITDEAEPVFLALGGQEEFVVDRERSESGLTPQVSVRYDWTDDVNVYAKWAKGFKAGGFNELNSNGRDGLDFDAEKLTAWEAGSKLRLLDGTAALNVGLFWNEGKDLQVFTQRPEDLVALVENVGRARARGIEIDGAWLATSWLTLVGGLGLNDAEYLEFPFGECSMDKQNTDGDGDTRCDLSGEPLYHTPKWTILLSPIVRLPTRSIPGLATLPLMSASGLDLVLGGDAEYQDVHFTTRTDDPRTRQPSFFRFNADLGLENEERGWIARVSVRNVTDETVVAQSRDVTFGGGNFVHVLEEQRLVVGSVRWRF